MMECKECGHTGNNEDFVVINETVGKTLVEEYECPECKSDHVEEVYDEEKAWTTEMTREEAIDAMVQYDIDNMDEFVMPFILRTGHKGYHYCSNEELEAAFNTRFGNKTKIVDDDIVAEQKYVYIAEGSSPDEDNIVLGAFASLDTAIKECKDYIKEAYETVQRDEIIVSKVIEYVSTVTVVQFEDITFGISHVVLK